MSTAAAEPRAVPPASVRGALSADDLARWRRPVAWKLVRDLALVWAQIGLGLALFLAWPGVLSFAVAFFLVAGGQHGLHLASHEFVHFLVVPDDRARNDRLGTWLFAAPVLVPLAFFRQRHFAHHRTYSTDEDTKSIYRRDVRGGRLLVEVLRNLTGFEYAVHVVEAGARALRERSSGEPGPRLLAMALPVLAVQAALFLAFALAGWWWLYFALWLLPLVTLQELFNKIRALIEHQPLAREGGADPEGPYFMGTPGPYVRTVTATPFERLCIAKLHFGYHAEHHLWPQLSYQHLPAARERLLAARAFDDPRLSLGTSYLGTLRALHRQPVPGGPREPEGYRRPAASGIARRDVPACPACGAGERRPLFDVREHEYRTTTTDRFPMVACAGCGAWYLDPRPDDSELATIYPPNYYTNVLEARAGGDASASREGAFYRAQDWLFRRRIRPIERHVALSPATRFLDVGCGGGGVLDSMRRAYGVEGVGLDQSERAVAICRERGFLAHAARFEHWEPPDGGRFDLVHSSHLIEHVASPRAYMEKVHELLAPGGVGVFITPNTGTFEARLFGRHWGGLHAPRHWVLLDPDSARGLVERTGFELLETAFSTNSTFWSWSLHSWLSERAPRGLCDALFPSDHRFIESSAWNLLRGALFTGVDVANTLVTGRSCNMLVVFRKPAA